MPAHPADTARAVFFDLDGTLVDTAPDMVVALQELQAAHGRAPVDYAHGRSHVSNGARGLLLIGFPGIDDAALEALTCDYIDRYANRLADASRVFDGIDAVLASLEAASVPWGVVTNKPAWLTEPLLDELGLADRCASIVSGDTLPVRKPDPAPLLLACTQAGVDPGHAVYIGDADRDISAGRAAGMTTIAAGWGYITADDDPRDWGADLLVDTPAALQQALAKAVNLSV